MVRRCTDRSHRSFVSVGFRFTVRPLIIGEFINARFVIMCLNEKFAFIQN